eukprot:CAMPEP_0178465336 /NCGR_PEP_ID=MMETSP0689_2-20121128/51309_1 /TAXON_ID=160604 /ORGANISM="Amphidinium massartii, Strain CS-259" /LENGTH=43 /DNA_ID= /DNA_START= /DNA_END= /DNA_ORIENTATION=
MKAVRFCRIDATASSKAETRCESRVTSSEPAAGKLVHTVAGWL